MFLEYPVAELEEDTEEAPSRTYKLDLEHGRIWGMVDGLEALIQSIDKELLTPRFQCLIYDDQYGVEDLGTLSADGASRDYITAALEGSITEALLMDSRVLNVSDFSFTFDGETTNVSFHINTVHGETDVSEEMSADV